MPKKYWILKQLKEALRREGYPVHIIRFALVTASYTVLRVGEKIFTMSPYLIVLGSGGILAVGAHQIIEGILEGEKAFQIIFGNLLIEPFQRRGRLTSVLSDKDQLKVTDIKMGKFIERIRNTVPEYPGGCSHIANAKGGIGLLKNVVPLRPSDFDKS